jgi:thioredoxin reductase
MDIGIMGDYDVIIIGGGPAGLTAGLYAARAGLRSLLLERGIFGGQIVNARLVENYPGFYEGISGPDLGEFMRQQATKYGLETITTEVTELRARNAYEVSTTGGDIQTKSIIIAAGSEYRRLDVAGEEMFSGRGVFYVDSNGQQQELMRDVTQMEAHNDGFLLTGLLGEQKFVQGEVRTIDFADKHSVALLVNITRHEQVNGASF